MAQAPLEDRLVDAAEALIEQHGAHGFSLREAARKVKVDPAMVYRNFKDRADLVRAVANRGFRRLAAAMQRALETPKGRDDRLRALGHAYVKFALAEPALFRLMFGPDRGAINDTGTTPMGLLVEVLGDRASPENAALCWAGVHGVATLALEGSLQRTQPVEPNALVELVLDAIIAQLSAPDESRTRRAGSVRTARR
ncbi:MAG: TetR/AcrR family transcriptional regulator [Myxococcaceae bacterium]|nr:TetR/AcrR family transcriptional regulator [Myxococcaceae bacterium]